MGEKKTFSQSLGFNRFQIGMKIQSVYCCTVHVWWWLFIL